MFDHPAAFHLNPVRRCALPRADYFRQRFSSEMQRGAIIRRVATGEP
jgi:hypothetical protein